MEIDELHKTIYYAVQRKFKIYVDNELFKTTKSRDELIGIVKEMEPSIYAYKIKIPAVSKHVFYLHLYLMKDFEIGFPNKLVKIARNIHAVNNMNPSKDYNLFVSLVNKLYKMLDLLTDEERSIVRQLIRENKKAATK